MMIDLDKCLQDGLCAQACPLGLIDWRSGSVPQMRPVTDNMCLFCGHCLAVCPQQALSLDGMDPGDCEPVNPNHLPTPCEVEHLLKTRRSIRVYRNDPVPRETIVRLLEIAGYGPSGHNTQPVSWVVVDDPNKLTQLFGHVIDWMRVVMKENPQLAKWLHYDEITEAWERGEDRIGRKAPCLIVAHAHKKHPMARNSCLISATYLELAAYGLGLGACWAGYFNAAAGSSPPLAQSLGLPEDHRVFASLLVGYPRLRYHRVPQRIKPRIKWL